MWSQLIVSWTRTLLDSLKPGSCWVESWFWSSHLRLLWEGFPHFRNYLIGTRSWSVFDVIHNARIFSSDWASLACYKTLVIRRWVKSWVRRFFLCLFHPWTLGNCDFLICHYFLRIVSTWCRSLLNSMVDLASLRHSYSIT